MPQTKIKDALALQNLLKFVYNIIPVHDRKLCDEVFYSMLKATFVEESTPQPKFTDDCWIFGGDGTIFKFDKSKGGKLFEGYQEQGRIFWTRQEAEERKEKYLNWLKTL